MGLFSLLDCGETGAGAENRGEREGGGRDVVPVHFSVEEDGLVKMGVEGKGPDEGSPDELILAVWNLVEQMAGVAVVVDGEP